MQEVLGGQGAHIDAFYVCPHHPEGTVVPYAIDCECRKPKVGLLEQAARDCPVDRARSFVIGDRDGDVEAAAAFGIRGVRFDWTRQSLVQIVRALIAH
jgi:D-glycero-D-manno-heptose 1,7-bisphosphate phosphatase